MSAVAACGETVDDRMEALGAGGPTDVGPLLAVMADGHQNGDASAVLQVALRLTGSKPTELAKVAIDRNGPAIWLRNGPAMVLVEADGKLQLAPVAPQTSGGPGRRPNLPVWPAEDLDRAPGHGVDAVEYAITHDIDTPTGVELRLGAIAAELAGAVERQASSITLEEADEADADARRLERERAVLQRRLKVLAEEAREAGVRRRIEAEKAEDARRAVELVPLHAELAAATAAVHQASLPKERRRWGRR